MVGNEPLLVPLVIVAGLPGGTMISIRTELWTTKIPLSRHGLSQMRSPVRIVDPNKM